MRICPPSVYQSQIKVDMSNLSPARAKRIFSQQTITIQNDNTTSVAYNYIPWTVMVFMNGSLLDETDVNTRDGKNLVFLSLSCRD